MPERHEDGTWTGMPSDDPLPGDPTEPIRNLIDDDDLLLALEVARIVLLKAGINLVMLSPSIADLDVSPEVLLDLGRRLEDILSGGES